MMKIVFSILIVLLLLTGCVNHPEIDPEVSEISEEHLSNSEISQFFIDVLYETGFDLEMDLQKYETAAKTIVLPNGKSLFENGFLYRFENLEGEEYAYGRNGALISLNTSATDDGEIFDTYQLYADSALSGISLPGGLSFGSTFEESLKYFDIYDTYQTQKSDDYTVELYNENDERLYIFFAGLHGAIMDNSLENAHAYLIYEKKQNGNTISFSLYYANGKLFACEYSAKVKNNTITEEVFHDKTTAYFYQLPINEDNIAGTIDSIAFRPDSVELTVTIKSATSEIETLDYYIDIMLSADMAEMLGPFSFEADENEKTQTSTYKNPSPSLQDDYLIRYMKLSGLGPFSIYNGRMYYDTNMGG